MTSKIYDGPLIRVWVKPFSAEKGGYPWKIKVSAPDGSGLKKFGYKAKGVLVDLAKIPTEFAIKVHDGDRAVWTEMPLTHRKISERQSFPSSMTR